METVATALPLYIRNGPKIEYLITFQIQHITTFQQKAPKKRQQKIPKK